MYVLLEIVSDVVKVYKTQLVTVTEKDFVTVVADVNKLSEHDTVAVYDAASVFELLFKVRVVPDMLSKVG